MKIALVTAYFYPFSNGGTEKYVLNLAKKLISENNEVSIITANTRIFNISEYQNIKVYSFTNEFSLDVTIDTDSCLNNKSEFKKFLDEQKYDVIHFHTLTPKFNISHFEIAKKTGAKIYFTAHIPAITCLHGDLMKFGQNACDGLILKTRCTACYISKKGLNSFSSYILAKTIFFLNYPITTAQAVKNKQTELKKLNAICDRIYLFTHWQQKVFTNNGFNIEKIILTNQFLDKSLRPQNIINKKIKQIGFVGRINEEKGLDILIDAFIKSNRNDLRLNIAGINNNEIHLKEIQKRAKASTQINWLFNLNQDDLIKFYKTIDVLVIPSVTYETGPFVLYEAIENNLPILANNLGDMAIWKEKGFDLSLYNSELELIELLKRL